MTSANVSVDDRQSVGGLSNQKFQALLKAIGRNFSEYNLLTSCQQNK